MTEKEKRAKFYFSKLKILSNDQFFHLLLFIIFFCSSFSLLQNISTAITTTRPKIDLI